MLEIYQKEMVKTHLCIFIFHECAYCQHLVQNGLLSIIRNDRTNGIWFIRDSIYTTSSRHNEKFMGLNWDDFLCPPRIGAPILIAVTIMKLSILALILLVMQVGENHSYK